ncbi:hypothetical protein [Subtercola sp. YIM 133946]|uniref:hypothetical protein n=1 Tax=Subtercola sp. YIM 133946 TaxID=3118909 RepID=UPI002F95B96F
MKALEIVKLQQRVQRFVEEHAHVPAQRELRHDVDQGLRELGHLRRHGSITEKDFLAHRSRLFKPLFERGVLE